MTLFLNFIGSFFAGVAKLFAVYLKGKQDAQKELEIEDLKAEVQAAKRLQNVKVNATRDAALERLRKLGKVRD